MGRLSAGCDSLERLSLGAYVLGALDPVERARFEEHASDCPRAGRSWPDWPACRASCRASLSRRP